METDTADVLLGTEGFGVVDLVALYFELHQAEVSQTHLVAHLKMTADGLGHRHHHSFEHATTDGHVSGRFLEKLPALDSLVVNGYSLVFAIGLERRFGLFFDPVFHKFCMN